MAAKNEALPVKVLHALSAFIIEHALITEERSKELTARGKKGLAYPTLRKMIAPDYPDTVKKPATIIRAIERLEEVISDAGYQVMRSDPDDVFSCIDSNGTLITAEKKPDSSIGKTEADFFYVDSDRQILQLKLWINHVKKSIQLIDPLGIRETEQGEIREVNASVYFLVFHNKAGNPYWIISYSVSNSGKDIKQCLYLKISRKRSEPAVGFVVILEQNGEQAGTPEDLRAFIAFLLLGKRRQLELTKFKSSELLNKDTGISKGKEIPEIRSWKALKEFQGTWEAFFINPIEPCFETAVITIQRSGKFRMWVPVDTGNDPYHGICRMVNDLLVIRYHELPELDGYRSSIIVNAAGYKSKLYQKGESNSMLYGVLAGVERNKSRPVATRFVMRKIAAGFLQQEEIEAILQVSIFNEKTGHEKFLARLDELEIRDFIVGDMLKEIISSDWVRSFLNMR